MCLKAIEAKYEVKPDVDMDVDFESDRILLDIPMGGIDVLSGWKIIPLFCPVVSFLAF